MAPHYPRSTDREMPFRSHPEIILAPSHPKDESVLQLLINGATFVLISVIIASAAISYALALLH